MLIAKFDAYGGEELLVNCSKNKIVILEKTDMQKRFEKWLSQTIIHQDYLRKEACGHLGPYPTKDSQNEKRKSYAVKALPVKGPGEIND